MSKTKQDGVTGLAARITNGRLHVEPAKKKAPKASRPTTAAEMAKVASARPAKDAPATKKPVFTLAQRLARSRTKFSKGDQLRNAIGEAQEALGDPQVAAYFGEVLDRIDQLAQLLAPASGVQSRTEWYDLPLTRVKKYLAQWAADGQEAAQGLLEELDGFSGDAVNITSLLWEIGQKFVRPARSVESYRDLSQLLRSLVGDHLTEVKYNFPHNRGVCLHVQGGYNTYLPALGNRTADMGWQFIRAAADRAKERQRSRE